MTPGAVAALLGTLALEELPTFVDALPGMHLRVLRVACEDREWMERAVAMRAPATVVVSGPPRNADDVLTAEELAEERKLSLDTVYRMEKSGELVALPRRPHGRLRFRRGDQPGLAGGTDRGYSPPHDTPRRQNHSSPTPHDTTRARQRPRSHGHDRRPLGTRGAGRDVARGGEPWAPGQGAWSQRPTTSDPSET